MHSRSACSRAAQEKADEEEEAACVDVDDAQQSAERQQVARESEKIRGRAEGGKDIRGHPYLVLQTSGPYKGSLLSDLDVGLSASLRIGDGLG